MYSIVNPNIMSMTLSTTVLQSSFFCSLWYIIVYMIKRIGTLFSFIIRSIATIEKRRRFIIVSLFLSFVLFLSSFISFNQLKYIIPFIVILTYGAVFFAILERINGVEWYMLFVHIVCFTIFYILFYFLLPIRWLTRIPFVGLYGIVTYALLLSSNIFNVGAVKSVQLFRVAFSINFFLISITAFFIFSLILSLKLHFFLDFISIAILIFPITIQFLWSINPSTLLDKKLLKYGLLISLFVAEIGLIFSFMPIRSIIFALFLTALFYSVLGLFHAYIDGRLFKDRVREFLFVLFFVFIITMLSVKW